MQRRQAIQNVALLLGGTIIGGNLFLAGGCKPATPTVEKLLTPEFQSLLAEMAETILPKTSTPGAKEAGVGEFIPVMVRDCYTPEQQKIFLEGLSTMEKLSKDTFGGSFEKITAEQRTELFVALDKEQKEYHKNKKKEDPDHYFRMLKQLTLMGFFTSEVGATQALRYVAVPTRFDACIDYKKGDRAWAT